MKIRNEALLSAATIAVFTALGCTAPSTARTRHNGDDVALMKEKAQRYENKDGSLHPAYLLDLVLTGCGKKPHKPVFDQPRGDDHTR